MDVRPKVAQPGTIDVRSPVTGDRIGTVPALDAAAVAGLVSRARAAQEVWAATPMATRGVVLRRTSTWIARHADDIVATVMAETGKTWEDAQVAEIGYTTQALRFWAARGPRWLGDERVWSRSPAVVGRRCVVRQVPRGVTGVIAPWNYPLANSIGDCIPALIAGNAVVLKPSEVTPLTALHVADGMRACGLPEDVLLVATGGAETGAALIDHVDVVTFTGSTRTGRLVAERAGRNLVPASLELGGKDPMIVLADADVERAANAAVYYGMQNAGQTCLSVERVYVEDAVYDDFVARVVAKVRALRIGPPRPSPGCVELGAITFAPQLETVIEHVDDAVSRGARILTGGAALPGTGRFFEPTVLVDVSHEMRCMTEETFGPTLPIMRVADAEEAVRLANDCAYGLAASIFTRDVERGERIARRLHAGSVAVNDAFVFYVAMELPMGGWKASGIGVRHSRDGIRKHTRQQAIVSARWLPRRDPHMFPYRRARSRALVGALHWAAGKRGRSQ